MKNIVLLACFLLVACSALRDFSDEEEEFVKSIGKILDSHLV